MTEKTKGNSGNLSMSFQNIERFKKMCRLLELKRRTFIFDDWKKYGKEVPYQQFVHLMSIRLAMPCNLARIMELTGLSSAGASIFVNKLVKLGIFSRIDAPEDRRNIIVRLTPAGEELIEQTENRLNEYIYGFFFDCTPEEIEIMQQASHIACKTLKETD